MQLERKPWLTQGLISGWGSRDAVAGAGGEGRRCQGTRQEVGQEVGEARPRSQGRGPSELLLRKVSVCHAVKSRLGTQQR